MMRRMLTIFGMILAQSVFAGAIFATPGQEHKHKEYTMEVGKKGEVSFDVETKVGELTLEPGRYQFQHRVENGKHFVRFSPFLSTRQNARPKGVAGEMQCVLEHVSDKIERTSIFTTMEGGGNRVTKIQVRGETVVHVF